MSSILDGILKKIGSAPDDLAKVMQQMGGEGALGEMASQFSRNPSDLMKLLDRDGDGSPLNDVMGMAKGLLGKD